MGSDGFWRHAGYEPQLGGLVGSWVDLHAAAHMMAVLRWQWGIVCPVCNFLTAFGITAIGMTPARPVLARVTADLRVRVFCSGFPCWVANVVPEMRLRRWAGADLRVSIALQPYIVLGVLWLGV